MSAINAPVLLATGRNQGWLWEDFIEYFYPIRNFAAVEMARGSLPLWDPFTFAGMPLLADVGAGLLYPPNLLLAAFAGGGTLSYRVLEWQLALHLLLAGFGAYFAAWRMLRVFPAALLAGFVFMACGFMTAHTIHLSVVQAAAWLPFVFLASWEAQSRRSFSWALAAGAFLTVSFLAGHPQTTLFLGICAGLVTLAFVAWPRDGDGWRARARPLLFFVASGLFALALATPQLIATREMLGLTIRQELTYEASTESSFSPPFLTTLVLPNFFGQAHGRDWSTYWGPGRYFYCWELAAFVGIVPLFLALVAGGAGRTDERRREIRFLWVLALFGLVLAMGKYGFLHPIFYYALPLYRRFRIPGRAVLLFDFAVALLAAFGLARLVSAAAAKGRPRAGRWWIALGACAAAPLIAGAVFLATRPGDAGPLSASQEARAYHSLVQFGVVATVLTVAFLLTTLRRARLATVLFLGATVADLVLFGWGYTAGPESPTEFFTAGREPIIQALQEEERHELFRVNTRPSENPAAMVLRRNQGPVYGIFTIEGYNQLKLAAFQNFDIPEERRLDLLNVKYWSVIRPSLGEVALVLNPDYLPRAFVVPDTRHTTSEEEALTWLRDADFQPRREAVIIDSPGREDGGLPAEGGVTPGGDAGEDVAGEETGGTDGEPEPAAVVFQTYSPNEIALRVNAPRGGMLVLSEIHYPAWLATVNGEPRPVERADFCLRGVAVPAGGSEVVLRMSDAPLRRGIIVTFLALVVGAVIAVREFR